MVLHTPSGGELVIYGEGTKMGSWFSLAARAHHYIQHGCASYLDYVVDTHVGDQISVLEVRLSGSL